MRALGWLAVVLVAAAASCWRPAAAASGTLDARLRLVQGAFDRFNISVADEATTAADQPAWHLSLMRRPPSLNAESYVTVPLMAAPMCIAFNLSFPASLQASMAQLDAALRGVAGATLTNSRADRAVSTADLVFAVGDPATSPASGVILGALLRADDATGFTASSTADGRSWPTGVFGGSGTTGARGGVVHATSDADVLAALRDGRANVGVVPMTAGAGLPCIQVRVTDPNTFESRAYRPWLPDDVTRYASVDPNGSDAAVNLTGNVYPVVSGLMLSARRDLACSDGAFVHTLALSVMTDAAFTSALVPWGFGSLGRVSGRAVMSALLERVCGNLTALKAGGSSAISGVAAAWALEYAAQRGVLVDYAPDGSGSGVRGAEERTHFMAASDSLLTPEDQLSFPHIRMTPATAFAVSVVFNVPGVPSLTLPRCVLVDIFKGLVTRWDDPRLQSANPAAVLPALAVKVTVRATKSGTTEVFTTGLRALEEACVGESQASIAVTSTWALNATIRASSTSSMLSAVQANDGTVGYVASAAAKSLDLPEADIIDDFSGVRTSTAPGFVTAAVTTGSVNESAGGAFTFPRTDSGYPFVGVTYFLVDVNRQGNCTAHRQALEWARFAISTTTGKQLALETGYVPLTPALEARALALIDTVRCDGSLLFPAPAGASSAALLVGITVAVVVVVATLVALQIVRVVLAGSGGRDIANAPCDNEEPFAIVFTDIQSSTALWATVPAEMGPALDTHHLLIRECIARHSGYEVKTIGDAFMVAFREAKDAVEFALELQEMLYDGEWPDGSVIDDVYHEVLMQDDAVTGSKKVMSQLTSPKLYDQYWRGLRVRVGVHFGHGDIKLDPVTKAYDYYGTVVNTAARIESVSHGGQVCVSREVLVAAYPTAVPDDVVRTSLGDHELRGLSDAVDLVQLLPVNLAGRTFPDLRLHKAAEVHDSDSTGTPAGTTDTGSLRSLRNSMRSSIGESGLYEALEGFAFTLIPAGTASKMNAEALIRYNNFTRTLLSSMKAKDRRDAINALKKSWRIEDDGRGMHRAWATQLGTDAYFTMLLAMRVGPAAESTLSMHPCMDIGQSTAFGKSGNTSDGSSMIGRSGSPSSRVSRLSSNGVGSMRRQLKQLSSPTANRGPNAATEQRYMGGIYDSPPLSPGDSPRMPPSVQPDDPQAVPEALTVGVDALA